jgi:hypothetical protein
MKLKRDSFSPRAPRSFLLLSVAMLILAGTMSEAHGNERIRGRSTRVRADALVAIGLDWAMVDLPKTAEIPGSDGRASAMPLGLRADLRYDALSFLRLFGSASIDSLAVGSKPARRDLQGGGKGGWGWSGEVGVALFPLHLVRDGLIEVERVPWLGSKDIVTSVVVPKINHWMVGVRGGYTAQHLILGSDTSKSTFAGSMGFAGLQLACKKNAEIIVPSKFGGEPTAHAQDWSFDFFVDALIDAGTSYDVTPIETVALKKRVGYRTGFMMATSLPYTFGGRNGLGMRLDLGHYPTSSGHFIAFSVSWALPFANAAPKEQADGPGEPRDDGSP